MLKGNKANLAERFATGEIQVIKIIGPVHENFSPRFLLKIAGRFVAPASMPNQGYRSRSEARRDATMFKRECWAALKPSMFD